MAGQVSPGIVLRERDLTGQTIVNQQANTAALVGSFAKGPVGVITNIATERELLDTFGAPNNNNYEDWFSAATFLSYGGQLQIVRINDGALKNAVAGVTGSPQDPNLYVENADIFSSGNEIIKIGDEYMSPDGWNSSGRDSIYIDQRGILGSAQSNHLAGATVETWVYQNSTTTATIAEELNATETIFDLNSTVGFAANDYARISITGEVVKIRTVESGTQVVVARSALGTAGFGESWPSGVTTAVFTKLDFYPTGTSTTLLSNFPNPAPNAIPLISSLEDFENNFNTYDFQFAAKTPGTWGNNLRIDYITGNLSDQDYNESTIGNGTSWPSIAAKPFSSEGPLRANFVVYDNYGNILEIFENLTLNAGVTNDQGSSIYYVDVFKRRSSYVYAGPGELDLYSGNAAFAGGVDAYTTNVSTIQNAFGLLADTEEIEIDFILTGGSLANLSNQVTKAQTAIDIASSRKDCIAFVSPHNGFVSISSPSAQRDAILSFFDSIGSTSYAVLDSGYKYIYDKYNDVYRYIPCNADVAGVCVQTSANSEDWVSPAGLNRGNIKNAVKLAYVPTKSDRDKLYQKRINPITSFPGQGVVLFGDKTALATPSAFDRINVRRLFLAMEKRIGQLAKTVLFELNDTTTRSSFSSAANSFLSEIQSKRGVTDFLVVCDESNNTADVIDRNEFVAEIYVKPTRSINYITITFVATRSGVSFSEVTGR